MFTPTVRVPLASSAGQPNGAMRALRIVALLAGLAVASAANSDVCEDDTEYDGSAEFTPGGATCGGSDTSGCVSKSDGLYWSCDYMLTTLTGYMNVHFTDGSTRLFVGDACSTGFTTTIDGAMLTTELAYSQDIADYCCGDAGGACDDDVASGARAAAAASGLAAGLVAAVFFS